MSGVSQTWHGRDVPPVNSAAVCMLSRNCCHLPALHPSIPPFINLPFCLQPASQPFIHPSTYPVFYFLMFILWFTWSYMVLVLAYRIFSCGMADLVPWQGIESRLPELGAWSLSHWIARGVPYNHSSVNPILPPFLAFTLLSIHPSTQPFTYPSYLIIFANWNMLDLCQALGWYKDDG